MTKRFARLVLTCISTAVLGAGCLASSPPVAYYSLYAPSQRPAPGFIPAAASTLAVSVGPVTLPDILRQARIATGGADGRYRLSEYHRWAGEVDRDLARALAEQLAANLGIEQVAVFPWDQSLGAKYQVRIDVLNMGGDPGKEATLAVRWTVIDPSGTLPAQARRSDLREAPADAGYPAWVAAQQHNVARLGEEIAGELAAHAGH